MNEQHCNYCDKLEKLKAENECIRQSCVTHDALLALFEDADRTIERLTKERNHFESLYKLEKERNNERKDV